MVEKVRSRKSSKRGSDRGAFFQSIGEASLSTNSNCDSTSTLNRTPRKAEHIFKVIGSFNSNKPAAATDADSGEAYIRRIFTEYERSSNKARSVSDKAERVVEDARAAVDETLNEINNVKRQYNDAVEDINRTCRSRMIKFIDNPKNEPYLKEDMPLDWLLENADDTTRQKVRAHSAKRSKTGINVDSLNELWYTPIYAYKL